MSKIYEKIMRLVKGRRLRNMLLVVNPVLLALAGTYSVPLFYDTQRPPSSGTMDSVAIWVAPDPNQSIIFLTDKTGNNAAMFNPVTKTYLGTLGSGGSGNGQLAYPNGVAVAYQVSTGGGNKDLVFLVERDNNRVSMFSLPDKNFIGSFGTKELDEPYGIALDYDNGQLRAWITMTGKSPNRVYVYKIVPSGQGATGEVAFNFPTEGALESIVIDPYYKRVYLCDESSNNNVMAYDFDGKLLQRFGVGQFVIDPEGIVLYDLGDGEGYIIVADQNAAPTEFEVFDRKTFASLGNFIGATDGTDGTSLTQAPLPNMPSGSFYAINSDRSVHVYQWSDIAKAMSLGTKIIGATTGVTKPETSTPDGIGLISNYPNPFNPETTIEYFVATPAPVHVQIFNLAGQVVSELVNGLQTPGAYQVVWQGKTADGQPAPSGTYLARLSVGKTVSISKMALLR